MIDAVVLDRPRYLSRVAPWVGKPLIKVVTGQRRVGKSCLLQTVARCLAAAEPGHPVLHLEMERAEWRSVGDADALLAWVAARAPTNRAAILIDEVQEIRDFDVALRSLATEPRLDLYVTGSSAELLSGEIATRFAGRSITIEVHPLSYDEFLVFHARADDDASLTAYLRYGGLPFLRNVPLTDAVVFEYLSGVANTALLADVVARHRTSASVPTVLAHVAPLAQAFSIQCVRRSDVERKRFFEVAAKHDFDELGLRAARRGGRASSATCCPFPTTIPSTSSASTRSRATSGRASSGAASVSAGWPAGVTAFASSTDRREHAQDPVALPATPRETRRPCPTRTSTGTSKPCGVR
jgi:hypothetical protein